MKVVAILLTCAGLGLLATNSARAEQARGTVVELHSCELYAGGCTVSSEATLGGQQLLRAWSFAGGTQNGVPMKGLVVAVLQASLGNLASPATEPGRAVVYLPASATAGQRAALLSWVRGKVKDLPEAGWQARTVPLSLRQAGSGYAFRAGDHAEFETGSLDTCEPGACGEALWYAPRSRASAFTVGVNRGSRVEEPLLEMKWSDARKRSVFIGRFGDEGTAAKVFVSYGEICGPGVAGS